MKWTNSYRSFGLKTKRSTGLKTIEHKQTDDEDGTGSSQQMQMPGGMGQPPSGGQFGNGQSQQYGGSGKSDSQLGSGSSGSGSSDATTM